MGWMIINGERIHTSRLPKLNEKVELTFMQTKSKKRTVMGNEIKTSMNKQYYKGKTGITAIDVIEDFELGFCLGNVVKYVLRAGVKNDDAIYDLIKARDYLEHEIKKMKNS